MKTIVSSLLLFAAVPLCAQDCAKSADACAAPKKALSPFLAASAAEPAAVKPAQAAKPALAAAKPAPEKAAPAVAVSTAPAAAPGGAASSPAWLLFVGALLAGLYFYLGAGRGKGKRK